MLFFFTCIIFVQFSFMWTFQIIALKLFFVYTHSIRHLHQGSGQFDKTIIYLLLLSLIILFPEGHMNFFSIYIQFIYLLFNIGRYRLACPFKKKKTMFCSVLLFVYYRMIFSYLAVLCVAHEMSRL